jgi:hypothetical protein
MQIQGSIGKYGDYQPILFGGKNMKSGREKTGKCKRKWKKVQRKKRKREVKGENKCKIG